MTIKHVCGNPQLEAIGHTRTCLQPESGGRSIMHSLQPCQLGNDSLLNMVPIPPLGNVWRGRPLVNHSEFQEDLDNALLC